jgi:two-component system sensor histidine kinase and response regulator WspE
MTDDLGAFSMDQLFAMESETQCTALSDGLVALEASPGSLEILTTLMRAAHSLKGAARIVGRDEAVRIAHAMEDCFVLGQKGTLAFTAPAVDLMLHGVDLLRQLGAGTEPPPGTAEKFVADCAMLATGAPVAPAHGSQASQPAPAADSRSLRVDANRLDHVLGFAGEGLVASRRLEALLPDFQRLDRLVREANSHLESRDIDSAREKLSALQAAFHTQFGSLDAFSRQWHQQADRLYEEALACRMRPIADILPPLRRLIRDLGNDLGKPATLHVIGEDTPVDREVLERLEAPLAHLLRNALDHGIEPAAERAAAGKNPQGSIHIDARHIGGQLAITISDDGRGVDFEALRARVVERGLSPAETVATMTEAEVLEFLFLPGFSMRDEVTEISGRGVGLDVVQAMARSVRGSVRGTTRPGRGLAFELRLPISLSVLRALLVRIAGEPYAFPLAHIARALRVPISALESAEGRQFFMHEGHRFSLAAASRILGFGDPEPAQESVSVLLLTHQGRTCGVLVDAFLGEQDLVVQPLDPAFGKIPGISSASLTADGAPLLIADVDDFSVAVERLASEGVTRAVRARTKSAARRRILVVEDSLTVRELERKLLRDRGYEVDVAVDGIDGWTAVRSDAFDLVLTDVDMPRMDGIELTRLIKADARLRDLPVMIVSYKDREEDRRRGLEAGADYYLAKGNFQDRALIDAVLDLIGEPQPETPS